MGEAVVRITSLLAAAGGSCSRGCTTQDKLHWWGKGLGDDECVALAERLQEPGRPRLKHLLLGSNHVGDRCIHALSSAARNGALKSLYALGLSRNRITDVGCEALAGAMRAGQLPQLTDLYISRNRVGNGCAAALASVLRIPRAPPLKRIGLGDGSADEAGLSSLLAAQLEELVGLAAAEPASYGARLPSRLRTVALLIGSASGAAPGASPREAAQSAGYASLRSDHSGCPCGAACAGELAPRGQPEQQQRALRDQGGRGPRHLFGGRSGPGPADHGVGGVLASAGGEAPREGPGVGTGQARQTAAPDAIAPPHTAATRSAAGCVLSAYGSCNGLSLCT
jgi:hypothetical protein